MARKRELIEPKGDKRYIRRDDRGRIKESDDVSRSLSQDRRKTDEDPGEAWARRQRRPPARPQILIGRLSRAARNAAFVGRSGAQQSRCAAKSAYR